MIKNASVEVLVRQGHKRLPVFHVLKNAAYGLANDLVERDNRPLHVDFRWHSQWLRSIGGEHLYEIKVTVIYGYVEAQHCINLGDLFYYTQADSRQQVLKTVEPTSISRAVFTPAGQIPAIAPPSKTKTFYRQRFFVRFPSVKCPLNQKAEIFNDYWELS